MIRWLPDGLKLYRDIRLLYKDYIKNIGLIYGPHFNSIGNF